MRINKLLSNKGICSRSQTRLLIEQERIRVNGDICIQGQWVEEEDEIVIDGKLLKEQPKIYMALNKPVGITCTHDESVKDNIIQYVAYPKYIFPVGRLDKMSEGLILLTNDGEWANELLEAEHKHEKEYIVTVDKKIEPNFLNKMSKGVEIQSGIVTRPCKIEYISEYQYKIILTQGLNKQIRRMSKKFGYTVVELKRIRIVNISLGDLAYGKWRMLTKEEVEGKV